MCPTRFSARRRQLTWKIKNPENKVLPVPRSVPARRRQGMLRGWMCRISLCFSEKSQIFTFAGNAKWRRRCPGRQRRVRHQLHPGFCADRKKLLFSVECLFNSMSFYNSSGNSRSSHFSVSFDNNTLFPHARKILSPRNDKKRMNNN